MLTISCEWEWYIIWKNKMLDILGLSTLKRWSQGTPLPLFKHPNSGRVPVSEAGYGYGIPVSPERETQFKRAATRRTYLDQR